MKIKGVYLQAGKYKKEDRPRVIEFERDNLDEIRSLLNCDAIDIVQRKFGDNLYCVILDDEGRLKPRPIVSAVGWPNFDAEFVGNLIVCGLPEGENITGINDMQAQEILRMVIGIPEWVFIIA